MKWINYTYLYIPVMILSVLVFAGCQDNSVPTSGEETATGTTTGEENALDLKITAEIAKADARVREFERTASGTGTNATVRQKKNLFMVRPGESIQAAVDAADPGATLLIKPGIYSEAVTITKSGITLIGLGGPHGQQVIIQNPGNEEDGVLVLPAPGADGVEGFAMYNITVRDFEENGVFLLRTSDYFIAKVTTVNDGEYGIFPVRSNNGVIFRSSAEGHTDAGIYIGQSDGGWILNCESYGNVLGFEIENSSNIVAAHNTGYNNTIGFLTVLLPAVSPFLSVFESENVWMVHNRLYNNNLDNFAEPGEIASFIPKGIGLLVMGVDRARVYKNTIQNNNLIGLGLVSSHLLGALAPLPPEVFDVIEPDPDNAEIKLNRVLGNGTSPPPLPPALAGVESDLFWDGSGDGNCWWNNTFGTSVPPNLPQCPSPGL